MYIVFFGKNLKYFFFFGLYLLGLNLGIREYLYLCMYLFMFGFYMF